MHLSAGPDVRTPEFAAVLWLSDARIFAQRRGNSSQLVSRRCPPILLKVLKDFHLRRADASSRPRIRRKTIRVESPSVSAATTAVGPSSFLLRHQFLIYRLFSLSGLIPVGAYLVVHLATNASIVNGPMTFQEQVERIQSLGVVLPFVEWTFILIPIFFHAAVGWLIISGALPNANTYPYASNVRYTLQRATGIIAFAFIVFHLVQLHHFFGAPFKEIEGVKFGAQFDPEHAASSAALALQPMWIKSIYAVGVLAVVYHFANGLWSQGITWGLWTSAAAQRRASWLSVVVGLGLSVVALSALWGLWTLDVEGATNVEKAMEQRRAAVLELQEKSAETPAAETSK